MNIVVIGAGKVGTQIAIQLTKAGHSVVAVDNSRATLSALSDTEDIMCIEGSAVDYETQKEAGVSEADVVIACTNSDEVNMLTCLLAKKHGAARTIARVRDPEYYDQLSYITEDLGLSLAINPEMSAADTMSRILLFPAADGVDTFSKGKVEVINFTLEQDNPLIGKSLIQISQTYNVRVLICAISRGGKAFIPTGSDILEAGDSIYIVADHSQMISFFKKIDAFKSSVESVIIVGGGTTSYYLAKRLLAHGMTVKIIEKNEKRCDMLASELPGALIVCADGSSEEVLREEGIERADAFIAMTNFDEVNAILSIFAKENGVEKVITKINTISFSKMLKNIGVENIISPKSVTANQIVRYIRAMAASGESNAVESLSRLVEDQVEALQFIIRDDMDYIGVPLKELKIKKGYLIASITRGRKPLIPGGNDCISIGDSVVVITTETDTQNFGDIFEK